MKKKIIVTFVVAILVCVMIPIVAHAETRTVSDGQTFDLATCSVGDIVQVDAGATATLTGTAPESVRVECGSWVNLTLDDVTLDCSDIYNCCPLKFTGGNNFLTLEGVSNIKGGNDAAGIGVPEGAKLTINGEGKVNSTAKGWGAGIGGDYFENAGTIIIDSGTIEANSSWGAGIGSSVNMGYEEITINGGTIRVNSVDGACIGAGVTSKVVGNIYINGGDIEVNNTGSGAGIGGGRTSNYAGTIEIAGGTIRANASSGAGIGSGISFLPWDVEISGGTIFANSNEGAGIGSGKNCYAGSIQISGGEVYVSSNIAHDIGAGVGKTGGTLSISGDAVVFLENEQTGSLSPTTTHTYWEYINASEVLSEDNVPSDWVYPIGAYRNLPNGAPTFTGDVTNTSQTILTGGNLIALIARDPNGASDIASFAVISGSLPSGVTLNSNGSFSGIPMVGDYTMIIEVRDIGGLTDTTTLNLIVRDILVTALPETTKLGFAETCTLSSTTEPAGKPITWSTSDPFVADVDAITGEVTAGMKEGRAVITAQSTSGYDECIIYVVDKSEPLPKPSDPENTVSVQIKDDSGNPRAGVYVSLFSEPQTVITDSNGIAVFRNVPYNTNDPHTLIVQDDFGNEIQRYSLNFTSGTSASTSTSEGSINITFDNKVNNTNIFLTMVEDRIDKVMVSLGYKPEKVENPQTGEDFAVNINMLVIMIIFLLSISLTIKLVLAKSQHTAR